ncbi:energy transducer TonB family protein [Pseudomonas syringae]|uniref:TonB C-terminal domain-containing protein n=1 Tax=Pseudomonas syringae TaxID=317 RepID=A0A085VR60_PSESX|nr:TonB family protein [Pseudomonas syringae]KFE57923.1 hypothetical protein IV01_00980 [Pseudomonas syringae]
MRFLLLVSTLLLSSLAQATNSYPKPIYLPDPDYPEEMLRDRQKGTATVRIFIHANGTVSLREVVKTSDPRLGTALSKVVSSWRFEPWTPPTDKSEGESTLITYRFNGRTVNNAHLTLNVDLKKLRCSQLNNELIWGRHRQDPAETKIFNDTKHYLFEGAVISVFFSQDERQALVDDFINAIPQITERCKADPKAHYADQLPTRVRALL